MNAKDFAKLYPGSQNLGALIDLARFFSAHPLTRQAPLKAWYRFANWQLRSRLSKEVTVPWIEGQRLVVRRGMTGATGNVYAGLHEFVDMMVALHYLRPGDLFLDVGANAGTYSVLAAGVCGAHTWAFEPDPASAHHLARNIECNGLDELVTCHLLALGSSAGQVYFTRGRDATNQVTAESQGSQIVEQRPLDALVGEAKPCMLKVDVEGYEEDVLEGARALLSNKCVKVIELETVTPASHTILTDAAFDRAYYDPYARKLTLTPTTLSASNALYVRDWPFVQDRLTSARPIKVLDQCI